MAVRPTPDAMRERAFAVLGGRIAGAAVLDLFAGTGAVGLEALSRGADRVVFVERHRRTARLTGQNCAAFDLEENRARVINRTAVQGIRSLAAAGAVFDLVWADPPFEIWEEGLEAVCEAYSAGLISDDGLACLECPERADIAALLPPDLRITRDLKGGASRVAMIEAQTLDFGSGCRMQDAST
jgi:16S rRNA (guanine966-N2)-methyltransferase